MRENMKDLNTPTNKRSAFTIVELVVVIVVIGILATIGTLSYNAIQKSSRDSERSAKATIITEGLERYYDTHGEYPSCDDLASNPAEYLSSEDSDNYRTPTDENQVSIVCNVADASYQDGDYFTYRGIPSECTTTSGVACTSYTLTYIKEGSETVATIDSRRDTPIQETNQDISMSAQVSGNQAIGTASALNCTATGTPEIQTRYSINGETWTNWANVSTVTLPASQGYEYSFQAQARCEKGWLSSDWVESEIASVTREVTDPGLPTITAAMSGSNAVGTAGGGSCAANTTIQRQIRYHSTNTTTAGSWSSWSTTSSRSQAAAQGYKYTFQQQARCVGESETSDWVQSGVAAVTRPVSAPSSLTISAAMSGSSAVGTAGGGSCPSGTSLTRQIRYNSTNSSSAGSWSSWSTTSSRSQGASQGYKYTFQQQARCTGTLASSSWSTSGSASTVRPINTPSAPSVSRSTSGSTTTFSRGSTSCPSGTSVSYQQKRYSEIWDSGWTNLSGSSWTWNTSSQGYNYRSQARARCSTTHDTSNWSGASSAASYIRPVSNPTVTSWQESIPNSTEYYILAYVSCGSGLTKMGKADIYTYDVPYTRSSNKYGWWGYKNDGTGWVTSWRSFTNYIGGGAKSGSTIPNGSRYRAKVSIRCDNDDTGRNSSEIVVTSPIMSK